MDDYGWDSWAQQTTRAVNMLVRQQADVLASLNTIILLLRKEDKEIMATQQTLTDLQTAVDQNSSVVGSAVAAFHGLADLIKTAAGSSDDAAVEALAQKLHESADLLAAAIVNVPSATGTGTPPPAETPPAETPAVESETAPDEPHTEAHAHRSGAKRR
jgi:ABC-type transporter Mla subunit MlaD